MRMYQFGGSATHAPVEPALPAVLSAANRWNALTQPVPPGWHTLPVVSGQLTAAAVHGREVATTDGWGNSLHARMTRAIRPTTH